MELDISKIVEAYGLFSTFEIEVSREDTENVNGVQMRFNKIIDLSKAVAREVDSKQVVLFHELTQGISGFPAEIEQFNIEFETRGPMVDGLPAKEASDRVWKNAPKVLLILLYLLCPLLFKGFPVPRPL